MNNYIEQSAIMQICSNNYYPIIDLQNVIGVGLGYKYINGQNTGIHCIQVFVKKKLNKQYIQYGQFIPSYYMGFVTDVVEIGVLGEIPSLNQRIPLKGRIRPLKGGYNISPIGRSDLTGTLGCIVYDTDILGRKKDFFILSNNHVIADGNKLEKGTKITQPSAIDEGGEADVVGTLYDFIKVKEKKLFRSPENLVDAAIAKLSNHSLVSTKMAVVGDIMGDTIATLGMQVKKVGEKTALTTGEVTSVGATLTIVFNGKDAIFKDQIICKLVHDDGDSGSVVMEKSSNKIIGLLCAGTNKICAVNNIKNVLDAFKVKIYSK